MISSAYDLGGFVEDVMISREGFDNTLENLVALLFAWFH